MKRFVMVIALSCVTSGSALAGEVPSVGPQPALGGMTQTTSTTSPGDVPTVGVADQASSAALSALLTLIGLLGI